MSISLFLFVNCKEEKQEEEFVAKVGENYLTRSDIDSFIQSNESNKFFVDEFVRSWIRHKVLLSKAIDENVESDEGMSKLFSQIKEDLLVNKLVENKIEEISDEINESELKTFYVENPELFKVNSDFFILNSIEFKDEESAIRFANSNNTNWKQRIKGIDEANYSQNFHKKYYEFQLPSVKIFDEIKYLNISDYSRIINEEPGRYLIIQLVEKYAQGSVPSFEYISDFVKEVFVVSKKQELLDDLVKEFSSNLDIQIKKEFYN